MSERTLKAIYAGPIGNNEGGFYAINLKTGQQIKRNCATIFPPTKAVIDRIQELATKDKCVLDLHLAVVPARQQPKTSQQHRTLKVMMPLMETTQQRVTLWRYY